MRTSARTGVLICLFLVAATTACSGVDPGASGTASPAVSFADSSSPADSTVKVSLTHCGVAPLQHRDRTWEVPDPPPFDGTNVPEAWTGSGTIVQLTPAQLRYRDSSGIKINFVPDDGIAPSPCA